MTSATGATKLAWEATVKWVRRYYPVPRETQEVAMPETPASEVVELPEDETMVLLDEVWECFVDVSRPGDERIRFRVNHRRGRHLTFTDPRARTAGTAGTTGLWGTLPPIPAVKTRPLTPIEFRAELARLVGSAKAEEITSGLVKKFRPTYDNCKTRNTETGG
jgi:hypothetical protein